MPEANIGGWTPTELKRFIDSSRLRAASLPKDIVYEAEIAALKKEIVAALAKASVTITLP